MIKKTQVFKLMGKKSLILRNNQGVMSRLPRKIEFWGTDRLVSSWKLFPLHQCISRRFPRPTLC